MSHLWIASYPRSGNTFLRTILWHCFKLRTASVHPEDLGPQNDLGEAVGHVELSAGEKFKPGEPMIVKTHNPPQDTNPAIYIVRDGRAATVSLWHFYNKTKSFEDLINGHHRFSTWTNHIGTWNPFQRPKTLMIRYEDMVSDLNKVLGQLETALGKERLTDKVPGRDEMAGINDKWIRKASNWQDDLNGKDLDLFYKVNEAMMKHLGYGA